MLIRKSFKYRLNPTVEQESLLAQHAGNTRYLWNKFLELNNENYKLHKKYLFSHELITSIPKIKENSEFLKLSIAQSLQQVGRHFDKAIKHSIKKETVEERKAKIAKAKTPKQKAKAYDYTVDLSSKRENILIVSLFLKSLLVIKRMSNYLK